MVISSPKNPTIKHIRKLLHSSRYRRLHRETIIEHPNAVKEFVLRSPNSVKLILTSRLEVYQMHFSNIEIMECSEKIIQGVSALATSPGILAIVSRPVSSTLETNDSLSAAIYLDGINNPSNLGAVCRNAVAFGVSTLFLSQTCADPFHPESIQSSVGSVFQCQFEENADARFSSLCRQLSPIALDTQAPECLSKTLLPTHPLLILGSEASGINKTIKSQSTLIRIQTTPTIDSLNVAVASGIILYDWHTQVASR